MSPTMIAYGYLSIAIIFETFATSCLKQSEQMSRLLPTVASLLAYGVSFFMLSQVLKTIPVGIAYAIWCAVGIVLISIIGVILFKQHLDGAAWLGLGLIVAGVAVINLFSKSVPH